jgi:hypothetical protein
MNADRDLERRLTDLYAAEAHYRAPDRVLGSVLDTIESTPQQRALSGLPRRIQTMNAFAKLAVAAVVVLAVGAIGVAVMSPRTPSVGPPVATPSPSPSQAAPSPTKALPTPTPLPTPAALTKTFTSPLNKIAIDYPAEWFAKPATQASTGAEGNFGDPNIDTIYEPRLQDHLFFALRSSPIGNQTAEQWLADQAVVTECPDTGPVTVDGNAGTIGKECSVALVVKGDRGYVIRLYTSGDEKWIDQVYTIDWFRNVVLPTVKLDPASS